MELKRMRTIAALVCGGGMAAIALTGCDISGNATASSGSTTTQPSSPPSDNSGGTGHAGGSNSSAGRSTSPVGMSAPSCMATHLKAEIQTQNSNSEEKGIATLILTNKSSETCVIPAGWAPIGTGAPDYQPLPATRTNYPGPGMSITLRPGRSVFAGMKWHTGPNCGVTSGIGVSWHSSWIPADYSGLGGQKPPICDSLTLGTIQPSMEGVNFT